MIVGRNIYKDLILVFLQQIKYLKPFLPKDTLLNTTILLISGFLVEIGLLCC